VAGSGEIPAWRIIVPFVELVRLSRTTSRMKCARIIGGDYSVTPQASPDES
jgi:hypothetical protein